MVSSGLKTKGHYVYPWCMEQLDARWSIALRKMIYGHYKGELPLDHPFRTSLRMYFDNIVERRPPCRRCTTYDWMNLWVTTANSLHIPGMNRLLALNSQLEYWKELPIQHLLNPMHIMKNVCHSLFLHLQGTKDTDSRRDDLEVSNTKDMLWQSIEHGVAPYVMPKVDKNVFFHTM
jgi:hypothetical protein